MTLVADHGLGNGTENQERRGRALGPRRSWASTQPIAPTGDREQRTSALRDERRWAATVPRYVGLTMGLDLLTATFVTGAALAPLGGLDAVTATASVATGLAFVVVVALMRGYDSRALGDGPAEFQSVARGALLLVGVMMAAAYTTQIAVPRRVVFVAVPVIAALSCLVRYAQRRVLHRRRRRGLATIRTLVVGDPTQVDRLAAEFARAPYHGYAVVGACTPSLDIGLASGDQRVPVLGAIADVPQVAYDHGVDVVVVAGSVLRGEALRRLSWALGRVGADLLVAPDLVEVLAPRLSLLPTATLSMLKVEIGAPRHRMLAKATLDHLLGTILALGALPIIAAAALAVRATSPGPAFFRQTRVGIDGRTFTMWKLRSMYVDAEDRVAALRESSDRDGPMFKMHSDPRITTVGRFLRKYSIDELPQLLNVVKGEMSLVGPRPPLVSEVAEYHDSAHRRLHVRPGLTGLWQVSGRADLNWEESVRLDLRYVDNWSVAMDMMILWKTGRAVLGGEGAY